MTVGELLNIEVEPQTRLIWLSAKARDRFSGLLSRVSRVYHETEYEMVAQGYRTATTANLNPKTFEQDIEYFSNKGLVFLPIARTKKYNGFAHKHVYTTGDDPDSMVYGVVGRDLESAIAFRDFSTGKMKVEHNQLGGLLGYPACCRDFFDNVWSEQRWVDTIYHQALGTKDHGLIEKGPNNYHVSVQGHPFCNQALRYFGIRITPQLSCSWACPETIDWGNKWFEVMGSIDKEAAEAARLFLEMPLKWDALKGLAIITTPIFIGITNSVPCYPNHVVSYTCKDPECYNQDAFKEFEEDSHYLDGNLKCG